MGFKDLVIKCLSDSSEVSFGRTMSAIAFLACLSWDAYFIGFASYHFAFDKMAITGILPSSDVLFGQVKFCAACYGINKITEIATALVGKWNA